MWRHYVYIHRRADTLEPFYVGKGSLRKRARIASFERAIATNSRSKWWMIVASKHGLVVDVIAMFATDAAAQEFEILLINEIGRRDLGRGPLVNLTDGGEGHAGIVVSADLRKKRSIASSRPRGEAWVQSIRAARKNGGNGGVVKHGDKLPESWRNAIAATKIGARNPMFGRTGSLHPTSRKVIHEPSGTVFDSMTAAAKFHGCRMQTLHNMLTGHRPNSSGMRLA